MANKNSDQEHKGQVHLVRGPVQPKAFGWLLGVLVIGGLVFSVMIMQLSADQYRKLLARQQFQSSIENRAWIDAAQEFQVMNEKISPLERVASEALPHLFPDVSSQRKSAGSIFTTINLINAEKFTEAADRFRNERDAWHKTTLGLSENLNPETKAEITQILDEMENRFVALDKDLMTQASKYHHVSRLEENQLKAGELFQLLARDAADLLYVPVTRAGEKERFQVYSSGVLQGLPVLPEIPDGLESLEQIQVALAEVGTRLPIRRTGDWEEFLASVESLRVSVKEMLDTREREQSEKKNIETELADLRTEVRRSGNEITQLAAKVMFLNLPQDAFLLGQLAQHMVGRVLSV